MTTFKTTEYRQAANFARQKATEYNHDMCLMNSKDLMGKTIIVVKFASWNDSDYMRCEIIRPGEPLSTIE